MALQQLGVTAVKLELDAATGFLPSPETCEKLITDKTKAIMLVSPCNPTGVVLPSMLAEGFAKLAYRHKIAL